MDVAMAEQIPMPHHRKRKRRRQDKPSISARLVLDDHVKGDVGIFSEDLFADLFPAVAQGELREPSRLYTAALTLI
jgi:peroxin-6